MKGDVKICGMEVSLSSLKKINLKKHLKELEKVHFHNGLFKYIYLIFIIPIILFMCFIVMGIKKVYLRFS